MKNKKTIRKNKKTIRKNKKTIRKNKKTILKNKKGGMIEGALMPQICFGTAQKNLHKTLKNALEIGYRHIDGADAYSDFGYKSPNDYYEIIKNELQKYNRDEIWLTWKGSYINIDHITDNIKKLGCKYIDLYLIHFWEGNYKDIEILIEAQKQGLIRHYGVSNCESIEDIIKLKTEPYDIYANQIQARPPGGKINGRQDMAADFIEKCNELGVRIMLFATISGYSQQYSNYSFYGEISKINNYYINRYILKTQNVLMVGSGGDGKKNLEDNFSNFNKIINGEKLLSPDEIVEIESRLKAITFERM